MMKKSLLDELLSRGFITRETYETALADVPHESAPSWVVRRLLGIGSALVLAGVVCFFAYNWSNMGIVIRFALPLLGILLCGAGAWKWGVKSGPGAACCVGAGVFAGTFLAVYGQEFQTGAFVYEVFGTWSLILLVLAVVSGVRWVWLCALYVFCIYIGEKCGFEKAYWPLLAAGVFSWAAAEVFAKLKKWPQNFRLWAFVPLWGYVTLLGLLMAGNWHRYHANPKYWVLPFFCALAVGAGLKLKSPAVLCGGAFSAAAFLCVFLIERDIIRGFFGAGMLFAVIVCAAGVLAWRGIQYMKGDK